MNDLDLSTFKVEMAQKLREYLSNSLKKPHVKDVPEMLQSIFILEDANKFYKQFEGQYASIKELIDSNDRKNGKKGTQIEFTEKIYKNMLKDIYATVLGEFVELPNNNPDYSRYDDIV